MKAGLKKLIEKAEGQLDRIEERAGDLVSDEAIEKSEVKMANMEEVIGLLEEALSVLEDD